MLYYSFWASRLLSIHLYHSPQNAFALEFPMYYMLWSSDSFLHMEEDLEKKICQIVCFELWFKKKKDEHARGYS